MDKPRERNGDLFSGRAHFWQYFGIGSGYMALQKYLMSLSLLTKIRAPGLLY